MRLVIDLQGAQTESRFRGIGRYSLALAQEIARQRGRHEVFIVLNGMFPETIEPLRAAFLDILPRDNIVVWDAVGPTRDVSQENRKRRHIAEILRESCLAQLEPDMVLITSLFEGLGDDAVTSIGKLPGGRPTAMILYDLIPLISPDEHFRSSRIHQDWYESKLASLRNSKLLLAISESARQEALTALKWPAEAAVNISSACEMWFRKLELDSQARAAVMRRTGIERPFLMYTGGADDRKNLHRLIEAYAALGKNVRNAHQLALVGKMPEGHVSGFRATGKKFGLSDDELVFTGYVSDEDLVALYNVCSLFVFPSTHEGFGLPPLEAMRCGAPVISANSSSLPEVIGSAEALFDPLSVAAIRQKIEQALVDAPFRRRLIENGARQARNFSWKDSAARAWSAMKSAAPERPQVGRKLVIEETAVFRQAAQRILLLKLDHMGDFLLAMPAIAKLRARYPHAELDIAVGSWNRESALRTGLFKQVFVLDYFKKISATSPQITQLVIDEFVANLEPYDIAIDLRRQADTRFILAQVKARTKVGYASFNGAVDATIDILLPSTHDIQSKVTTLNRTSSSIQMLRLVDALPAESSDYLDLPQTRVRASPERSGIAIFPLAGNSIKEWAIDRYAALARRLAGQVEVDTVTVYFGTEQESKRFPGLDHPKVKILHSLTYAELRSSLERSAVCVANNSFGAHIASDCGCLVVGVYGGHETPSEWGPIYSEGFVVHTAAPCSPCHLATREDCKFSMACLDDISVDDVFKIASAAFEKCKGREAPWKALNVTLAGNNVSLRDRTIESIAPFISTSSPRELTDLARCIAANERASAPDKQLLVDVTYLVRSDEGTGIQRVVRAILQVLLASPPAGFSVEPVFASEGSFRYARNFTGRFGKQRQGREDDVAEAGLGDVFLGLDLNPALSAADVQCLETWRKHGAQVHFVVYDLLPLTLPWAFPTGTAAGHQAWLEKASKFDGLIAISRSVADETWDWLQVHGTKRSIPLRVGFMHLGSDIANSSPSKGISASQQQILKQLSQRPTLVMVGTVEPRKSHKLVLRALEHLWDQHVEVNLLVVGKQGWTVDELCERMRTHRQKDRRLFWAEGASDEFLEAAYKASSALIAASEGEGFGLPLIEAARHGLALIARDLPVFREVAGMHATYFPRHADEAQLAGCLREWLALWRSGAHVKSEGIRSQSWKDTTRQLVANLRDEDVYRTWLPDGVMRFHGSDARFHTHVGVRNGQTLVSGAREGHLLCGNYMPLKSGAYQVRFSGSAQNLDGGEFIDIVHDQGRQHLAFVRDLGPANGDWSVSIDIVLAADLADVEIRVWVCDATSLSIDRVEIEKVLMAPALAAHRADAEPVAEAG